MMEEATLGFLGIWGELEAAYHGRNGFGTNVAEIYAYRLLPMDPQDPTGTGEENARRAGHEMERIIRLFQQVHSDAVIGYETAWREFTTTWDEFPPFNHRVHIQVTKTSATRTDGVHGCSNDELMFDGTRNNAMSSRPKMQPPLSDEQLARAVDGVEKWCVPPLTTLFDLWCRHVGIEPNTYESTIAFGAFSAARDYFLSCRSR